MSTRSLLLVTYNSLQQFCCVHTGYFEILFWTSPCCVVLGGNMCPFWWYNRGIHSAVLGWSTLKDWRYAEAPSDLVNKHSWLEIGPVQDAFSIQNERFHPLLIFTPQDVFTPNKLTTTCAHVVQKDHPQVLMARSFCPSTAMSTPCLKWVSWQFPFRQGCQSPGFFSRKSMFWRENSEQTEPTHFPQFFRRTSQFQIQEFGAKIILPLLPLLFGGLETYIQILKKSASVLFSTQNDSGWGKTTAKLQVLFGHWSSKSAFRPHSCQVRGFLKGWVEWQNVDFFSWEKQRVPNFFFLVWKTKML